MRIAYLGANVALLFVFPLALRGWITLRFTYYEPELIGASTFAWSVFVFAAIVLVVAARRQPGARWLAWGILIVLVLIVGDQATGARRNDQVSPEGVVVGWVMVLQLVALAGSIQLADPLPAARRAWDGRHVLAIALVAAITIPLLHALRVPPPEAFAPQVDAPVAAPVAPPLLQPSGKAAWIGHALDFRNWTSLPVILVNERGGRVDVGACERIGLDGFDGQVTVRAERGYIATFGWWPHPSRERTTFVILLPQQVYLDASPPAEPLPRCYGKPLVQEGI